MRASPSPGFFAGCLVGGAISLVALLVAQPESTRLMLDADSVGTWVRLNLGTSVWFFGAVLIVFIAQLVRLKNLLNEPADKLAHTEVSRLDQFLDVWVQVFIGIGVIWTAIGMRSALQAALADPGSALTDTAGNVLRDLVDGGILLALSTTIVGAIGGYLMRLLKTATVGADLQAFFATHERAEVSALLAAAERIEARLAEREDRGSDRTVRSIAHGANPAPGASGG